MKEFTNKPKAFYGYVPNRRVKTGVSQVETKEGELTKNVKEAANVLNNFKSEFTEEPEGPILFVLYEQQPSQHCFIEDQIVCRWHQKCTRESRRVAQKKVKPYRHDRMTWRILKSGQTPGSFASTQERVRSCHLKMTILKRRIRCIMCWGDCNDERRKRSWSVPYR